METILQDDILFGKSIARDCDNQEKTTTRRSLEDIPIHCTSALRIDAELQLGLGD